MRGPEHVSVAVLTTGGALWLMNGQLDVSAGAVAAVSAAAIGSLVPDIDHPQAWISNRIPATMLALGVTALGGYWSIRWSVERDSSSLFGPAFAGMADMIRPFLGWAWLSIALGVALLAVSFAVAATLGHRGPTHSLAVAAALTLVASIAFAALGDPTISLWFGWGYLTHLLTDMLTPMGCPALLWPLRPEDRVAWAVSKPAMKPMKAPGAQVGATPSANTSVRAPSDSGLAQPVEDLQSHMTTGLAKDVLAPVDSESGRQDTA